MPVRHIFVDKFESSQNGLQVIAVNRVEYTTKMQGVGYILVTQFNAGLSMMLIGIMADRHN